MNLIRLFITLTLGLMIFVSFNSQKISAVASEATAETYTVECEPNLIPESFIAIAQFLSLPDLTFVAETEVKIYLTPDTKFSNEAHSLLHSNLPPPVL